MPAESGDVFARQDRVRVGLIGLVAQPGDDRNAVVAENHEAVVHVAHHAGEFELENAVQVVDDFLGEFGIRAVSRSWRSPESDRCRGQCMVVQPGGNFRVCECQCESVAIEGA